MRTIMTRNSIGRFVAFLALVFALVGCQFFKPAPLVTPGQGANGVRGSDLSALKGEQEGETLPAPSTGEKTIILAGRVAFPKLEEASKYQLQSTVGTVLDSATITLLNDAGNSLATGVTDRGGSFSLTTTFNPALNGIYVLEAVRGFNNASPGSEAGRLRTLVKWDGSAWLSMTNNTATDPVVINHLTTSLALTSALDPINVTAASTIGKVIATSEPSYLNNPNSGTTDLYATHSDKEINGLAGNVLISLSYHNDPVAGYSGLTPEITSLSATNGGVGTMITITGKGFVPFTSRNRVNFGGAWSGIYLATATKLIVMVPGGARTGDLRVDSYIGDGIWRESNTKTFTVDTATITVDPGAFTGSWIVYGVHNVWQKGTQTVTVSEGRTYALGILGFQTAMFTVGTGGTITFKTGSLSSSGAGNLGINTVDVAVTTNQPNLPWHLSGVTTWYHGDRTVAMPKGNRGVIYVSGFYSSTGIYSEPVLINIDDNGFLTSESSMATGSQGALAFNVSPIVVNLNGYAGSWLIAGMNWRTGNETVSLIRGGKYRMHLNGAHFPIYFAVDSNGVVSVDENQANGGAGSLSIPMVDVDFNTNGYLGYWRVSGVHPNWEYGSQKVKLPTKQRFSFYVWPGPDWKVFEVDAAGNAIFPADYDTVTGGAGTVNFNTHAITVNPNGYRGLFHGDYLTTGWLRDTQTIIALAGVTHYMNLHPGDDIFRFRVDKTTGAVTADDTNQANSSIMISGGIKTISFNLGDVDVNLNGVTEQWYAYADSLTGWRYDNATIKVVKGSKNRVFLNNGRGIVWFRLNNDNTLTSIETDIATVANDNTSGSDILFDAPITTTFNNGGYTATWFLHGTREGWVTTNPRTYKLAKNRKKRLEYPVYTQGGSVILYSNMDGTLTQEFDRSPLVLVNNAGTDGSPHSVTFDTRNVKFTIAGGATSWRIYDGVSGATTTNLTVKLIKNMNNWRLLRTGDDYSYYFETASDGTVRPNNVAITLPDGTGTVTFTNP